MEFLALLEELLAAAGAGASLPSGASSTAMASSYNNFSYESAVAASTASMGFQHILTGLQHIWTSFGKQRILNHDIVGCQQVVYDCQQVVCEGQHHVPTMVAVMKQQLQHSLHVSPTHLDRSPTHLDRSLKLLSSQTGRLSTSEPNKSSKASVMAAASAASKLSHAAFCFSYHNFS